MNIKVDHRQIGFSDIYKKNTPIISLEFFPPKDARLLNDTCALIDSLRQQCPDFMTVTYGAGGSTRLLTKQLVSYIHNELEMPVVAHLTCVEHTLSDIEELLANYKELGINKILALRGDPPVATGHTTKTKQVFKSALELTQYLNQKNYFSIAVAGYPEPHKDTRSPTSDLSYLKAKVDAGAELIITQLFFDAELYFSYVRSARKFGINIPIVPGIMPIANFSQIEKITRLCGATIPKQLFEELYCHQKDNSAIAEIGTRHTIELCQKLMDGGAPGLHIYTLNKPRQVCDILQKLFPERRV